MTTPQQIVLAKFPLAKEQIFCDGNGNYFVILTGISSPMLVGKGDTEKLAWEDAAKVVGRE